MSTPRNSKISVAVVGAFVALLVYQTTASLPSAAQPTTSGQPVVASGGVGQDFSGSVPTVCGTTLATYGPIINGFWAQNQSAIQIQVVLDDMAGKTNPTVVLMAAGAGADAQGASTDPIVWHHGRVRICTEAAAQTGVQYAARAW